jgi:hypothetical protein
MFRSRSAAHHRSRAGGGSECPSRSGRPGAGRLTAGWPELGSERRILWWSGLEIAATFPRSLETRKQPAACEPRKGRATEPWNGRATEPWNGRATATYRGTDSVMRADSVVMVDSVARHSHPWSRVWPILEADGGVYGVVPGGQCRFFFLATKVGVRAPARFGIQRSVVAWWDLAAPGGTWRRRAGFGGAGRDLAAPGTIASGP